MPELNDAQLKALRLCYKILLRPSTEPDIPNEPEDAGEFGDQTASPGCTTTVKADVSLIVHRDTSGSSSGGGEDDQTDNSSALAITSGAER